jgi:glycosyltransferase involved in cell wall biosynthesis
VREAMACGCPVVRMPNLEGWRQRMLQGLMSDRNGVRVVAEAEFDPVKTARQFKQVIDAVTAKALQKVA